MHKSQKRWPSKISAPIPNHTEVHWRVNSLSQQKLDRGSKERHHFVNLTTSQHLLGFHSWQRLRVGESQEWIIGSLTCLLHVINHSVVLSSAVTRESIEETILLKTDFHQDAFLGEKSVTRHSILRADPFGPSLVNGVEVERLVSFARQMVRILHVNNSQTQRGMKPQGGHQPQPFWGGKGPQTKDRQDLKQKGRLEVTASSGGGKAPQEDKTPHRSETCQCSLIMIESPLCLTMRIA